MREFVYPARFIRDRKDGGYVVSFRDVPEAITQADSLVGCHEEAAGALQAAIEGRIMDGLEIPVASRARRGERTGAVPVHTALKAALYLTMREHGITRVELARRLRIDEKAARRMLYPHHATKAERFKLAQAAFVESMTMVSSGPLVAAKGPRNIVPIRGKNFHGLRKAHPARLVLGISLPYRSRFSLFQHWEHCYGQSQTETNARGR